MTNETIRGYSTGGNVSCTATSSNTSISAAIVVIGSPNQLTACKPNYMANTNKVA
jgi:hypothetical protein